MLDTWASFGPWHTLQSACLTHFKHLPIPSQLLKSYSYYRAPTLDPGKVDKVMGVLSGYFTSLQAHEIFERNPSVVKLELDEVKEQLAVG